MTPTFSFPGAGGQRAVLASSVRAVAWRESGQSPFAVASCPDDRHRGRAYPSQQPPANVLPLLLSADDMSWSRRRWAPCRSWSGDRYRFRCWCWSRDDRPPGETPRAWWETPGNLAPGEATTPVGARPDADFVPLTFLPRRSQPAATSSSPGRRGRADSSFASPLTSSRGRTCRPGWCRGRDDLDCFPSSSNAGSRRRTALNRAGRCSRRAPDRCSSIRRLFAQCFAYRAD